MKKLKNVGFIIGTVLLLAACLCAVIVLLVPNSSAKYAASSTATGTVSITYSNEIKCTGGTADCDSLAVCEICGNEYGSYHHSGTETWEYDEEYHWQIWSCCRTEISEKAAHSYTEGLCACGRQSHYHIYELVAETAAGCTTTGTAAHYVCTNGCDLLFDTETKAEITAASLVIEAKGHSYNSTVTAPTCTAKGYTTYKCSRCGDTYTGNEVEALGHKYGTLVQQVNATCTSDGMSAYYKCSTCQTYFDSSKNATTASALVITSPGHSATTWTKDSKNHYKVCTTCSTSYDSAAHNSNNSSTTKAATCTATGTKTYTCSVCSYVTKTETIDALGHDYGNKVSQVAATCTSSGMEAHYKCSRCSTYFTTSKVETTAAALKINATGHTENDTYSTNGTYHWKVCSTCSTTVVSQTKHSITHEKSNGASGKVYCSVCGKYVTPDTFYDGVELTKLTRAGTFSSVVSGNDATYGLWALFQVSSPSGQYLEISSPKRYMVIEYGNASIATLGGTNKDLVNAQYALNGTATLVGFSMEVPNATGLVTEVIDITTNSATSIRLYLWITIYFVHISNISFFDSLEEAQTYQSMLSCETAYTIENGGMAVWR